VMLGDNGIISRPLQGGQWITLTYALQADHTGGLPPRHPISTTTSSRVDRVVTMVDTMTGAVAGSDLMYGGLGDDDIYGQFDDTGRDIGLIDGTVISDTIGDELHGEAGEDALVGDQGVIDNWVVDSETEWIEPNEPFIDDHIFIQDTLFRETTLEQILVGGDDRMTGGDNADWMHGGAAEDLMNGNAGNDRLFGDDGDDVLWGGPHHDHLWGGWGDDYLDVRPRPEMTATVKNKTVVYERDPEEWFAYAEEDHYQGVDYVYGGWNQDAMQANIGDEGPVPGDRLLDWVGTYNVYYLCPGLYGEFVATRDHSPAIIDFLQQLALGDGAVETATEGSSGFRELAMVFADEGGQNAHPVHPDTPGHFVCWEPVTPTLRVTNIELSAKGKGDQFDVTGQVLVQDWAGNPVEGATVSVEWILPDDSETPHPVDTDKKGVAAFTTSGGAGIYTLAVTEVALAGYDFDAGSSVLIATLDTSGG